VLSQGPKILIFRQLSAGSWHPDFVLSHPFRKGRENDGAPDFPRFENTDLMHPAFLLLQVRKHGHPESFEFKAFEFKLREIPAFQAVSLAGGWG
jgi:hypothetical protein